MLLRSLEYSIISARRAVRERRMAPDNIAEELEEDFVLKVVSNQDRGHDEDRIGQGEYLHASSLIDLCPRQHALAAHNEDPLHRKVTGGHRVMWAIGRAIEHHIRGQFIKGMPGALFGRWECRCGRMHRVGFHVPERELEDMHCGYCRGIPNRYYEVPVYDHDAKIVGSSDLPFRLASNRLVIGEIKSVRPEDFTSSGVLPFGDHVFQAAAYRRLYRINGFDVDDCVSIVYCNKRFLFGTPYQEFHVDVSGEEWEAQLDRAWRMAGQVAAYRDSDSSLPPRELCPTDTAPRARRCPMAAACFGRRG